MKYFKIIALSLLLVAIVVVVGESFIAAPVYKGNATENNDAHQASNFDGTTFYNTNIGNKKITDLIKLSAYFLFKKERWPKWVNEKSEKTTNIVLSDKPNEGHTQPVSIQFINHSTFLIKFKGLSILTDPIFSKRASPFSWVGPKRAVAPAMPIDALPHIDVIVISHNHYDHLDIASLKSIYQQQANKPPLILAGLGNAAYFKQNGLMNAKDLDWNESITFKGAQFNFTPCQHRSGRGITDQMKTLWGSFVIEHNNWNLYFAGDTGYSDQFLNAYEKFGKMDVSLLPVGAYEPRWFMKNVHMDPEQAVQAHQDLQSKKSIGMHFGAFQLTLEHRDKPALELQAAKRAHNVPDEDFIMPKVGDTFHFSK